MGLFILWSPWKNVDGCGVSIQSYSTPYVRRCARRRIEKAPSHHLDPAVHSHHLVAATLEFVRHLRAYDLAASLPKESDTSLDERRRGATQRKQREDPHFSRYATQLHHCGVMKPLTQLRTVQKQKMRAERQVEHHIIKWQEWQLSLDVSPLRSPLWKVR